MTGVSVANFPVPISIKNYSTFLVIFWRLNGRLDDKKGNIATKIKGSLLLGGIHGGIEVRPK